MYTFEELYQDMKKYFPDITQDELEHNLEQLVKKGMLEVVQE